ncbi:hypothetical protein PPYR_07131 [Photinus pyralis]|uniref:Gem-associated protein 8 n=1 Tax=Photinus pyralis TaxID=7054 RepID=A0A1Y1NMI8_PHOPY|nr:uncharacterized protein LOC116169346 [Photinus pyralis]KAB0799251.1 hypothetical protein PPYR_07131 [Photinus pyralis]
MVDCYCEPSGLKTSSRTWSKKDIKFLVRRKLKKNRSRILRRKRSRLNYWKQRKQLKTNRYNQTLCDTISVCSITDMDYQEEFHSSLIQPIPEVAKWHNQHQISYWKSRALALELENNLLHKHIENLYAKQTQEYADCGEYYLEQGSTKKGHFTDSDGEHFVKRERKRNSPEERIWKAPEGNARQKKLEDMKNVYGDMAPKILGMETAIQLSYDLYLEKYNPKHWPNIPLRL